MSLNVDNAAKTQATPRELPQSDPSASTAAKQERAAITPAVQSLANSGTRGGDAAAVDKFLGDHPEQKASLQDAAFAARNYTLFHQLSQPAAGPAGPSNPPAATTTAPPVPGSASVPAAPSSAPATGEAQPQPPANPRAAQAAVEQAPSTSPGWREFGFALAHPIIASEIGSYQKGSTNLSTDAVRFSTLGPPGTPNSTLDATSSEGSQVNAFRHVLWQATIASRYGSDIAKQVGDVHEENPNVDLGQRTFKTLAEADQTIDLNNNVIGRQIAAQNPDASMKELALKTLEAFHTDGLYTVSGKDSQGNVTIDRTKISDAQYNEMKALIDGVDDDGFTPQQRAQREAESVPVPLVPP